MRAQPLVTVIITNHNGMSFLEGCFKSIYGQTYKNFEVIMVDNASTDESINFTRKKYPKVKIIINNTNEGYAGGNNTGFRQAKGEYIMILNNDVVLQPDLIESLLKAYDDVPNLGAVQPMVKLMGTGNNLDACGSFWTDTGFNYHYGIYKNADLDIYKKAFPVYSLKGVCMLIPRRVIEKTGLFDKRYWCYFEETDFCHRVWLAGYECWYYPKSFLYHKLSGTRLKKSEAFIQFNSFKNRLCSYIKNLGRRELLRVLPAYFCFNILSSIVYLTKGNMSCFLSVYKSIWWNIVNIRETLRLRAHIQDHLRKRTDKEIFGKVRKNPRWSYYFHLIDGLINYADA